MFSVEQNLIEQKLHAMCVQHELPDLNVVWSWIPFSGHWGISTSFFQTAAAEAKAGKKVIVPQRAQEIALLAAGTLAGTPGFEKIEAVKGYLNLYFSTAEFARRVIDTAISDAGSFGRGMSKHEQVMVEFSQPNTHKAFHVGHLRSAILGDTLALLLDFAGFDVIRANYPGDIGLHVIKWLWNYMTRHMGERPEKDITRWMGDIYLEANRRLEESPELEAEVRALYTRWDQRDPAVVSLWKETRQWSLDGFTQLYDQLGIRFDRYYFNSMAEEAGKEIVADLIKRGIARDERPEGPVIVKLDELLGLTEENYRVFVVLRSDGTALYATEDLALAKIKFSDYPELSRSLYVVDVRQSLHFRQVFKTLELAGYDWATRCQHIAYELVNLPGNVVMASRDGAVVLLEDLIREAIARALEVVEQKNPDLTEDQKLAIARAVGIGAIKFPMLARENGKIVTFDWEQALDFEGQAAPYIQYAYVRGGSILRKAGGVIPESVEVTHELHTTEVSLIDWIARFPSEVQRAAAEYRPMIIAAYAYELARAFNDFYMQCPVLQTEDHIRNNRLRLVAAARQALANSLALLGITAPEAM